jgi:endoglucanase
VSLPLFRRRGRALAGLAAGAALVAAGAASALMTAPFAHAGSIPSGTQFYTDPNSQAARWVAANPNDSRAPAINSRIAQVPSGIWFANYQPSTVTSAVQAVTGPAASAGRTPVLVVYDIPNRDCGGASAGGAPDLASYQTYVQNFAAGLGSGSVVVILEPDALALQTCLSAAQVTARDSAIATAVTTLKSADANAKVYLDAGHSAWNSASDQASRLNAAGVRNADGFFSNVSNFNPTANEVNYDKSILSALGNPANLHAVVDTSRNGNGSNGQWCDPSGRALGVTPTASTGDSAIDAYLWVKPPGEADGCADAAGTFDPALAYALITNGPSQPASPTSVVTTAPASPSPSVSPSRSPSPSPSASPTAPASASPTGGGSSTCHVTYTKQSEWTGGFVASVTIANTGGTAINGWTLRFSFAGDQKITSFWNTTITQSGTAVTATNVSFNGAIPAAGSVSIGFQGTFTTSDTSPTAFTVNGSSCA